MTPAQKCVLMALADRADENGVGWPSIPWICEWTCFGRTAVIEALKSLEAGGLVQISKVSGRNNLCAIDLERVRLHCLDDSSSQAVISRPGGPRGASDDVDLEDEGFGSNPSVSCTRPGDGPVRDADYHPSGKRTTTRPPRGLTRPPGGPDTSLNTKKTPNKHSVRAQRTAEVEPEGFAQFWSAYPFKTGKVHATKAFRLLNPPAALLALMLAGLAKWKRHERWTKDGGKYRHHASTWLNQRLWEDEAVCGRAFVGKPTDGVVWWREAGFDHIAEAQNARCHIGNFRDFRAGKRIALEVAA